MEAIKLFFSAAKLNYTPHTHTHTHTHTSSFFSLAKVSLNSKTDVTISVVCRTSDSPEELLSEQTEDTYLWCDVMWRHWNNVTEMPGAANVKGCHWPTQPPLNATLAVAMPSQSSLLSLLSFSLPSEENSNGPTTEVAPTILMIYHTFRQHQSTKGVSWRQQEWCVIALSPRSSSWWHVLPLLQLHSQPLRGEYSALKIGEDLLR